MHHWFKSYGHVSEGVDFAYWLSCIGKGLRLQPVQQACLENFRTFVSGKWRNRSFHNFIEFAKNLRQNTQQNKRDIFYSNIIPDIVRIYFLSQGHK